MIKLPQKTGIYLFFALILTVVILLAHLGYVLVNGSTASTTEYLLFIGASYIGSLFVVGVLGLCVNLLNQFIGGSISDKWIIVVCLLFAIAWSISDLVALFI